MKWITSAMRPRASGEVFVSSFNIITSGTLNSSIYFYLHLLALNLKFLPI